MNVEEHEGGKPPAPTGEEDAGDQGLGTETGANEAGDPMGDTGGGSSAEEGPVKGAGSEHGGGDDTGPTPDGVPQEGEVNPDADTASDST
ncbi:MAG: hypothetical protein H0V29_12330 [Thermoleophilaceae bacterium]|nr:hypothetical protein [Thermoleophilaceae bacterium]